MAGQNQSLALFGNEDTLFRTLRASNTSTYLAVWRRAPRLYFCADYRNRGGSLRTLAKPFELSQRQIRLPRRAALQESLGENYRPPAHQGDPVFGHQFDRASQHAALYVAT